MAENENMQRGKVFNANDSLDINELASLNEDISADFLEQLQNQVTKNASEFTGKSLDAAPKDSELFEEVVPVTPEDGAEKKEEEIPAEKPVKANIDTSIDDNFIKKYKAKLNKQQNIGLENETSTAQSAVQDSASASDSEIENLTSGNITEKPATKEQVSYNDSLDLLDDNIKYTKYVIYIDPENTEFIESLTVKERKNLINRILREQDNIALTKHRANLLKTIIKHSFIAIITIAIMIPIVYFVINASLESTIDNYRRSQTIFKTLYKEQGKIKNVR